MAELAVVGLVGNIIQFIDFGVKLVSATRDVHGSLNGTTAEVDELTHILSNVQSSNERVKSLQLSNHALSQDETTLLSLVKECEKLAKSMQKVLDKLKKRNSSWKTYEDLRVAFQTLSKRKDLEDLRRRLEALDSRIRTSFSHMLQHDQHSATMMQLDKIIRMQKEHNIHYDGQLDDIRSQLINLMQQRSQDAEQQTALRLLQLAKLSVFQEEHAACLRQIRIIPSLYVPVLSKRWRDIPCADRSSNSWLFGPELSTFTSWLRDEDGVYLILGKPGSGKSTLMKFASEHSQTMQALQEWAAPARLFTASYYFWNQGFELQKSQRGLFQSLLYQILRAAPVLEKYTTLGRLEHEVWEIHHLELAFQRIAEAEIDAKFCFFIDGLDEYDGRETEVVGILGLLTRSRNIKVCVSSRFRSIIEHEIRDLRHTVDISDYTKRDMANHVRNNLLAEARFKRLHSSDHIGCEKIVNDIAEHAKGVWLWVALVTKDLVHAVKTGEQVEKLQEITNDFPRGLDKYFERMINDISPSYQVDMAKMFLLAIYELQPLPLFAFSLLDREKSDVDYAIKAPYQPVEDSKDDDLKSRVQNRCGDLMVVEDGPHPIFLSQPVDFMHRTVAEYLRDNHDKDLRAKLDTDFDPMLSLCRIQLFLLKSLDNPNLTQSTSINQLIGLTDELLYYAREIELRVEEDEGSPATKILDEVDKVNTYHARNSGMRLHWTHLRDNLNRRGLDLYDEGGHCNFLALCVQARLTRYVRVKLKKDPGRIAKQGRPLVDYALRPLRNTPVGMQYHSEHDDPVVNVEMVQLLLRLDPCKRETINKPLYSHEDRSVWELFLVSCHETAAYSQGGASRPAVASSLQQAWFTACEDLLEAGANPKDQPIPGSVGLLPSHIITVVFGEKAPDLLVLMEDKRKEMRNGCSLM